MTLPATTCTIANTALASSGTAYTVTATYAGTPTCPPPRKTATTGLTVTNDPTTTAVSETPTSVVYGNECASVFTATVTTGNAPGPPGL